MQLFTLLRWLLRGRGGQLSPRYIRYVLDTRYGQARPPIWVMVREFWRFLGWMQTIERQRKL